MDTIKLLKAKREALLAQISKITDFRPGNLLKVYRQCGNPNCHCARPDDPGHPGWQLSRKVKQKTITRRIPHNAVELTGQQVDEYQRFRELVHELTEVSESLCDLKLQSKRKKKHDTKPVQTNLRS